MREPAPGPARSGEAASLDPGVFVQELAEAAERKHAFRAESRQEAEAWQRAFRPELKRLLGLDAIAGRGEPPLAAERLESVELADHIRESWTLETEPGFHVPFYFLRPRQASGKLPLVLVPHGHTLHAGKMSAGVLETEEARREAQESQQDAALQAVRRGFLAIAPDMRAFGALRRREEAEKGEQNSCHPLQMRAILLGRCLVGERVWDMQRLLDWALTRPEVDGERVAITGHSGGGTVSLFTAAVDERIRVAVPVCYFCTFRDSIVAIHHCACNFIPGLLQHAEMYDVAGLIAPRPFLAVNGALDPIFPVDAVRKAHERLRGIYEAFGAADVCKLHVTDGGHRYDEASVWPFIQTHIS